MALRFGDSFDHYATADRLLKWSSDSAGNRIFLGAYGRNGTNGMQLVSTDAPTITKTIDAQATWVVGFAIKFASVVANGFFKLLDAGSDQLELRLNSSGNVVLTRAGTTLATGTQVLTGVTFYFVELKTTIADAGGTAIVRINGVEDINFTGDTKATANATANQIQFWNQGNVTQNYDDLYVCDGTGGAPTDTFLGDVRVQATYPSGNGNSSQLVGQDADSTDNYLNVDETAQDGDTTYVESSTVGNKDTYAFGNLTPTTGTVYGVQVLPFAKKTDAGTRSIVSVARLSGTEVDSAVKTLTTDYIYLPDIREAKPGGGTWSITDVNNAEFGIKINA